jgi:hypothetical protein
MHTGILYGEACDDDNASRELTRIVDVDQDEQARQMEQQTAQDEVVPFEGANNWEAQTRCVGLDSLRIESGASLALVGVKCRCRDQGLVDGLLWVPRTVWKCVDQPINSCIMHCQVRATSTIQTEPGKMRR